MNVNICSEQYIFQCKRNHKVNRVILASKIVSIPHTRLLPQFKYGAFCFMVSFALNHVDGKDFIMNINSYC